MGEFVRAENCRLMYMQTPRRRAFFRVDGVTTGASGLPLRNGHARVRIVMAETRQVYIHVLFSRSGFTTSNPSNILKSRTGSSTSSDIKSSREGGTRRTKSLKHQDSILSLQLAFSLQMLSFLRKKYFEQGVRESRSESRRPTVSSAKRLILKPPT